MGALNCSSAPKTWLVKANHADVAAHFAIAAQSSILRRFGSLSRSPSIQNVCKCMEIWMTSGPGMVIATCSSIFSFWEQAYSVIRCQPMRHGRMRASDVILPQGVKGRRLSSVLGEKQLVPWQAPRWSRSVKRFKQVRGASDKVDGLMGMIYSRDKMVRQSCYDGTSAGCRWFEGVLKGSNDATHCYSGNHDIHNGCFHMQYLRPNASLGVQTI